MIFNTSPNDFESEKERNLYYKVFCGYFFNELIPDYDKRLVNFIEFLKTPSDRGNNHPNHQIILDPDHTHVSFDNHIYMLNHSKDDRGEFADILITCSKNKNLISIEAKLHSDWSFEKDIRENQKRLDSIIEKAPGIKVLPYLLITRKKYLESKKKAGHKSSNYNKFQNDLNCKYNIILWEDLVDIIPNESVRKYLSDQLNHNVPKYELSDDWFRAKKS